MHSTRVACFALATFGTIVAACSDGRTPTQLDRPSFEQTQNPVDGAEFGFTAGWLKGQTTSRSSAAPRLLTGVPSARRRHAKPAPTAPSIRGPGRFPYCS